MRRSLRFKLVAMFGVVFVVMGLAAAAVTLFAGAARSDVVSLNGTYVPATGLIGDLHLGLVEYQRDLFAHLLAPDAASRAAATDATATHKREVADSLAALGALPMSARQKADVDAVSLAWSTYQTQTAGIASAAAASDTAAAEASLVTGDAARTMASIDTTVDDLTTSVRTDAAAASARVDSKVSLLPAIVIGGGLVAVLIGFMLAFVFSRGILAGVRGVSETLTSMADYCTASLEAGLAAIADNDLTVVVEPATQPVGAHGQDEIGHLADTTNRMLSRLHATMASYEQARVSLSDALAEVHSAASSVSLSSTEVNQAAVQSGQGSQQIAQTIGQVAVGAADQAHAASETANSVNDLRSVIEQVRVGAAETARSVESQAAAVDQMTRSIRSASWASSDVQSLGAAAGEAATNGAQTVRQTVEGMTRIKTAVEGAAVKVTELGAKGDQIGAIVETIDDIAEQTNLLALNAAIEAARAGEQGKGFAVVADEVRKLAERSSRATKEIAALIAEVQQGTEHAVKAMQIGAREVEAGAELATKSGAALDAIAGAVGSSNAAVARIVEAMDKMQASSAGLVLASDAIAAIAQETNASAASMTGSAEQVARAVESIAAISEENSASAEEVSAATEQMSAQSEEVVANATTLADMAAQLESLVARFKLAGPAGGSDFGSAAGPIEMAPDARSDRRPRWAA